MIANVWEWNLLYYVREEHRQWVFEKWPWGIHCSFGTPAGSNLGEHYQIL
jgi:hypothetical protein